MDDWKQWGQRLERVRRATNLPQKQFAIELDANQSDISRWEAGKKPLPKSVQQYITNKEVELNLDADEPPSEQDVYSSDFCYGATTHRRIWADSKKRIRRMTATATIKPCVPKVPGFADIEMTVRFEGVVLPPNDALYLDCLGVMPELEWDGNFYCFDKRKGSEISWVPRGNTSDNDLDTIGTVEEIKKVQATLGPHALGYQLLNVVEDELVEITTRGKRGVRTDQIDAIGVPVYADCPVELISLSVTFENLIPRPTPRAQVYLLRRTLVDSHPLHLVGGLEVTKIDENKHKYSFENLRYPRPGFGFCIAWRSLR